MMKHLSFADGLNSYSLPPLTGFWFPILIHQWIIYQGVGSGASCVVLYLDFT